MNPVVFQRCSGIAVLRAAGIGKRDMGPEISAVMVDSCLELASPCEVMVGVMKALVPGGRVVFVGYQAEDPREPIKPLHKTSASPIEREAAVFAPDRKRTVSTLPWQHVVVFRWRG